MGSRDRGRMAQALRRVSLTPRQIIGQAPLALLWAAPLVLALASILAAALDPAAWFALFHHPQLWKGLALSLFIGSASAILATTASLYLTMALHRTKVFSRLSHLVGGMIALPHFAFAVGFGFLIMPTGLIARLLALPFGWTSPPQWVTTQDPFGIALLAALAFKETPFLIWLMTAILQRRDFAGPLAQLEKMGASLGHGSRSTGYRIVAPLMLRQLIWPITIVWVYGCSVVDMALAIGPTQPPPLQLVIWADLNSAIASSNARGTAGAMFLALVLAVLWLSAWMALHVSRALLRQAMTRGPSLAKLPRRPARFAIALLVGVYVLALVILVMMSVAPHWPFPVLLIEDHSAAAWRSVAAARGPLFNSLFFAVTTTATALLLAVAWLELMPARFDGAVMFGAVTTLALPSVLLADGLYLAFLPLRLGGTYLGVYLAQLAAVFAYMFITLSGPYRALNPRFRAASLGLNATALRFLVQVKLPLLKPVLWASAAIGVAVSMAQYVPVQLVAAGRLSTWPIEAVTLASGGARHILAAYALVMALVPALAFMASLRFGRSAQ
jgi:putative thiamine transport system permease protein